MAEEPLEEGQGPAGGLGPGAGAVLVSGRQEARAGLIEFLADLRQDAHEKLVHVVVEGGRRLRVATVVFRGQLRGVCAQRTTMTVMIVLRVMGKERERR